MNTASISADSTAVGRKALILLIAALLVRVLWLNTPFLEPFNSIARQSICAQVARNFYARDVNLFHPQIDVNGNGPSLYNAEMPLYSWLMALGYRVAGGPEPWAARSVTVLFSMLFLWCLYRFARAEWGERPALWALAIAAFSPLSVALSRSIQPDMTMLALLMAALWWARRYGSGDGERFFWGSAACLWLAVATKVFALLALPAALLLTAHSSRPTLFSVWRRPRTWVYALIALSALGWYAYMWLEGRRSELGYEPFRYAHGDIQATAMMVRFFSLPKFLLVMKILVLHHLTLGGVAVFGIGLWTFVRMRVAAGVWWKAWAAGLLTYSMVFWPYMVKHGYYQLPWLPWIAIVAGVGTARFKARWVGVAVGALLVLHAAYYYPKIYWVPDPVLNVERIGSVADQLLPKDALIIGSYGSSPAQVYYANRRGWSRSLEGPAGPVIAGLENLRHRGAEYLVLSQKSLLTEKLDLAAYLGHHGEMVYDGEEGFIYQFVGGEERVL